MFLALFFFIALTRALQAGAHDASLQNIQNGVGTRAGEFIQGKFDAGPPVALTTLAEVRQAMEYVLAALYKNPDAATVADANARLVNILNLTSFTHPQDTPPAGKLGIYFEIPMFLQVWYLFNQDSGVFPGRLSSGAGGSESALKQWYYSQLTTFSKVKVDDSDLSKLWIIIDSENHDLTKKGSVFMMANALRNDPGYRNLYVNDGITTVAETAQLWENYYTHWFNARARKGTLVEMASPTYFKYSVAIIYLLRDYGANPPLRSHADQFLTLLFADYAQEYSQGTRAGAKTRTYMDDAYNVFGAQDSIFPLSELYYNYGSETSNGKFSSSYIFWPAVVSSYRVPLEVMDIALYPAAKGNYEFKSTRPAYEPVKGTGFYDIRFPNYLYRYSYVTPDYINGVFTIDPAREYANINDQNRWMGVMFSGSADTRAALAPTGTAQDGQTGYRAMNGVGYKDAMVIQKPSIALNTNGTRVYVSYDLFSVKTDDSGWLFTYDPNGAGYLALKPANGTISSWTDVYRVMRNPAGTYITNGADANTSYGTSNILKVKNDTSNGSMAYLRLNHPGDGTVGFATLRLYVNSLTNGTLGSPVITIYGLTNDDDPLNAMTWNNGSPNHEATGYSVTGIGTTATMVATQTISAGSTYYDIDVTSFVNAQIGQSNWQKWDNTFTFLIVGQNADGSEVVLNSSLAGSNRPEMKVLTGKYGTLSDQYSPVVFQTAQSSSYASFADFVNAVKSSTTLSWTGTEFHYTALDGTSLKYNTGSELPRINNVAVNLNPAQTYDSPFLSATYDSPIITIRNTDDEVLTLDFSLDADSLTAHWALNEGSGATAANSAGSGFNGTVTGATWTNGVLGSGLSFDGSGDYVSLPGTTGLSTVAGSVSLWVKYTSTDGMLFYGSDTTNGNGFGSQNEFHLHATGATGQLALFMRGATANVQLISPLAYNDGAWHHVAATWDSAGAVLLYVDGNQVASAAHTGNLFGFTGAMRLGSPGVTTARMFSGVIDEVKIFTRAISADLISELAQEILPVAKAYWNLDEGSGTIANDLGAGNYDGTVSGATWTSGIFGGALSFDGVNDYVNLPTTTGMSSSLGSVSLWFKSGTASVHGVLFYGSNVSNGDGFGSHNELHLHMNPTGTLGLYIRGTTNVNIASTAEFDDGKWHHAVATWDINGSAILYVDGVQVASAVHDANVINFSAMMRLGGTGVPTVRPFAGQLDEIQIFDVVLNPAQVNILGQGSTGQAPVGGAKPGVFSTTPTNGNASVLPGANITLDFDMPVNVSGTWFSISGSASGIHPATVTGGPTSYTLNPSTDFSFGETVTVTVVAAGVTDAATGTQQMCANYVFTFSIEDSPPVVTGQPLPMTVNAGAPATFSITATGSVPLVYQWRKNGTPITGSSSAATATLAIASTTFADTGTYDCVVSNTLGSAVSAAAVLTVNAVAPVITTQPAAQFVGVGGNASLTVAAAGIAPLSYQWRKNGTPIPGASAVSIALSGVTHADSGYYSVVVTNSAGSATSNDAAVVVSSTPADAIYWDFATAAPTNGVPAGIAGGTFTQGNNNGTTALLTAASASSSYTGASGGNNAGASARTGVLNKAADGSVYFEFTLTPDDGRQLAATELSFGARSTGTGPQAYEVFSSADGYASPIAAGPLLADGTWRLITTTFAGVIGNVGTPVTFRVYGYDGTGSPGADTANWFIDDVRLTAGLLALPPAPPTVTQPPADQTATVGETVTFNVSVIGTAPFTYQWRRDGVPLTDNASASTAELTLPVITSVDAGDYDVIVTNIAGTATSESANLTVNKAVATVTLDALNFVYNGLPCAATATTNPAGLTVRFTYDGGLLAPTNAGSYTVVATVEDADYAGSATATLAIAKAPAVVSLGSLNQTYTGLPLPITGQTNPAALAVELTYEGSLTAPTHAGSYAVVGTIIDPNFTGSASDTLVIAKAPALIALSQLDQVYDGAPKPVTTTTTPTGLALSVTYNGVATVPSSVGHYAVVATINEPNYSGSTTGTLAINPAIAVITLDRLIQAYDGMPKAVTVATDPASLAVTVTYNGSSTVPVLPGSYDVVATINTPGYTGSATGMLRIVVAALVRHAPTLNGGIIGSVQQLLPEDTTLNGSALLSGDLLVPGMPSVRQTGRPSYGGTLDGTGAAAPANYTITLGGKSVLSHVVRRIDPIALSAVSEPPAPTGTRNVTLNHPSQSPGDFAMIRDLTLNENGIMLEVPPGTYGALTVNGNNVVRLGVPGGTTPTVYNFRFLTLNDTAWVEVVGPVIINLANGTSLGGDLGTEDHPEWLTLNIASGGLTLNGSSFCAGTVIAPNGTITVNDNATLIGSVECDRLVINSDGLLDALRP